MVRQSSSYYTHLVALNETFKAAGFSQLAIHLRNGHEMEMLADWGKVIEKAG